MLVVVDGVGVVVVVVDDDVVVDGLHVGGGLGVLLVVLGFGVRLFGDFGRSLKAHCAMPSLSEQSQDVSVQM